MAETWRHRWEMIESRWQVCVDACWNGVPRTVTGAAGGTYIDTLHCQGAIEALAHDLWALWDWLLRDPASSLDFAELSAFLNSPDGYHVRACGDLVTRLKHFQVNDARKHLLELEPAHDMRQGVPIVFRAVRVYQHPSTTSRTAPRVPTGDTDVYEDAVEMLRRAIGQWNEFLISKSLIQERIALPEP